MLVEGLICRTLDKYSGTLLQWNYSRIISRFKEYLSTASDIIKKVSFGSRSPNDLEEVNHLQRSLSDIAIEAYEVPHFFTEEAVDIISIVLTLAGEYLRGTVYEKRALERPSEFKNRVYSTKKAAEARDNLRKAFKIEVEKSMIHSFSRLLMEN